MIQPTPPMPATGQVGEQQASRPTAEEIAIAAARSADTRSWSGANMSDWLQLFPALDLEQTLVRAAGLWQRTTHRNCLLCWNSSEAGALFAFAGQRLARPQPAWLCRLVTQADTTDVTVGTLVRQPGNAAWLDWLGIRCEERELLCVPLALDEVPAQGHLCFFPAGRSVPAVDSLGLDVTARALWQATLFESQLRERKLSALAELAAGAGHEVNNPLGTILGRSQQLLREEQHPERRRWLATIGAQALRVRDMISDLMLFARPVPPRRQPVDLATIVRQVQSKMLTSHHERRNIVVDVDLPQDLLIDADANQTEIVLSELFRNALGVLGADGVITLVAERAPSAANPPWEVIRLRWSDNGPGLTPLEREHLFDPFFSGRQAGRGLGFGLSKCWRILQAHGGSIRVANPGGEGAQPSGLTLLLEWPAAEAALSVAPRRNPTTHS